MRARHVEGDPSSDYGRIQRQQRFLGALLRSVLSAGTLLDPGRLEGLVEAVSRSTFGENIGADQLLSLSQSLGSLDPRTVSFVTVPTTGARERPRQRGAAPRRGARHVHAIIEQPAAARDRAPAPGRPARARRRSPPPTSASWTRARPAEDRGDDEGEEGGTEERAASDATVAEPWRTVCAPPASS